MARLTDLKPINRDKIREFFLPPASRTCIVCQEDTIMDVEDKVTDYNTFPIQSPVGPQVFQCTGCLTVVCDKCYMRYFKDHVKCASCRMPVKHLLEMVADRDDRMALAQRVGWEAMGAMMNYCVEKGLCTVDV